MSRYEDADREELLGEFRSYLGRQPGTRPGTGLSASTINSYVSQARNLLRGFRPTDGSRPTHDSAMVHWRAFLRWWERQGGDPPPVRPEWSGPPERPEQPPVAEPDEVKLLGASVPGPEGTPPALTYELRSAIASYAIAHRRLAALVGNRSIVGTVGETYVAVALDGVLASNSTTGFDVTLPDGRRVQVKTRMADASGGGEFGGFTTTSVEQGTFDVAAFVQLDGDLLPTGALCLRRDSITEVAKARGGKLVCFWPDVARHPGRIDIGPEVSDAALGLRPGQDPRPEPARGLSLDPPDVAVGSRPRFWSRRR